MQGFLWRWLERRLARSIAPDRLAPLLGDLHADYEHDLRVRGPIRARLRLVGESLSLLAAYRTASATRRSFLDRLRLDARQGWRSLAARPAATLGTIGVLALGIGLVASMFALADPYVTRPLPYTDPGRLATLSVLPAMRATSNLPTIDTLRSRTDLFAAVTLFGDTTTAIVAGTGGDQSLRLLAVSPDYLTVLGAAGPALFDWHTRPDFTETPIVLTAAAARRLGTASAPGSALSVVDDHGARTGRSFRIRGALAATFLFPSSAQGWDGLMPLEDGTPLVGLERTASGFTLASSRASVLARLRRGVEPDDAARALSTSPTVTAHTMPTEGYLVRASGVVDAITARLRPLATGALAAGVLILVVCAANVASLLIARGVYRTRELATREALGASRADLGRLVFIEIGLLTTLGIAAGLAVARLAIAGVGVVIPAQYVVLGMPAITARVVAFACAAGGIVMIAGLLPAIAAWRAGPNALFQQASAAQPRGVRLARMTLTAAQTAVAVVLLVGAMLLARSYVNLLTRDPGYAKDAFAVAVRYPNDAAGHTRRDDVDATAAHLRTLPGVTDAAIAVGPLVENISGGSGGAAVSVDGAPVRGIVKRVSANFFQAAGGRLIAGRLLTAADERRAGVVSESFARLCCGDRSPLGHRAQWRDREFEIVGVVKDVFDQSLDRTPMPALFLPIDDAIGDMYWVTYMLRLDRPTQALAVEIDHTIHAVTPRAAVADGASMRDRLMRSIRDRSFATLIVCFFALAAIGVSAAGIVGVVSSVVARRTREIAIRVALGAGRADVRRLVTGEAAWASGAGAAVGLTLGAWMSTTMESLLFGVSAADPASIALAAVVLAAMVAAAAWLPARRAVKLSPTDALRME